MEISRSLFWMPRKTKFFFSQKKKTMKFSHRKRRHMESCNHVSNDIENPSLPLVVSVKTELENLSSVSSVCCIYRVSERLRRAHERAYTPQAVSIGPLHHGKESLRAMEEHKKRYLRDFLRRTNVSLEHYINIIKAQEERLRSCYAEPIELGSDEFVKMVLVDAAFVVEVLLRNWYHEFQDEQDHGVFNKSWMLQGVFPDLWLLENQLPFFILEDLLVTAISNDSKRLSITELSVKFGFKLLNHDEELIGLENIYSPKVLHFVDFLRRLCLPLHKDSHAGGKLKTLTIPSVSELIQSGVRIKLRSSKNIFDIRFSNGVFKLPKMIPTFVTELALRNILAFEQCHCRETYVNDYIVFMNRLISTPKDLDLLVKHGIVESMLGDSVEVFTFINKLADGVIMNPHDFYFAAICEELNAHCRAPWNTWKANLKQNYFNTPWTIVSVIAAFLLIFLTLIQTVCSILSLTTRT